MTDSSSLLLFALAALVLAITPGPAVLYIVARSVSQGRAAGIVSCAGIALGGFVHVAAAAAGLSALLASGAGAWLRRHPRHLTSERYVVGSVYLGLGVATAFAGHGRKPH